MKIWEMQLQNGAALAEDRAPSHDGEYVMVYAVDGDKYWWAVTDSGGIATTSETYIDDMQLDSENTDDEGLLINADARHIIINANKFALNPSEFDDCHEYLLPEEVELSRDNLCDDIYDLLVEVCERVYGEPEITYHANTNPEFRGSDCDDETAKRHAVLLGKKMVEYLQGECPYAKIYYDLVNRDGISHNNPIATISGFNDEDEIIDKIEQYEEKIWIDTLGEVA